MKKNWKKTKKLSIAETLILFIFVIVPCFLYLAPSNIMVSNDIKALMNDYEIIKPRSILPALSSFKYNYTHNLTGHAWDVREVIFSPDGNLLASGSHDGSIKIWNVSTGKCDFTLLGHHYDVISLAFTPDGLNLLSGGWDKKIVLWDIEQQSIEKVWTLSNRVPVALDIPPDGSQFIVGSGEITKMNSFSYLHNNTLELYDLSSGNLIQEFFGHNKTVSSVHFSNNGSQILSGSWDTSIKIWDSDSGVLLNSFNNHSGIVTSVMYSEEETEILSSSFDNSIRIWNISQGKESQILTTEGMKVWDAIFTHTEDEIAVAVGNHAYWPDPYHFWEYNGARSYSELQIWNLTQENITENYSNHEHIIESLSIHPVEHIIASGSWDWNVMLWSDHTLFEPTSNIDYWDESPPESQGFNTSYFNSVVQPQIQNIDNIHALLIIKNGYLVYEYYFDDGNHYYDQTSKHVLFSATKSFTSALVGILVDKGFLSSIDQPIVDIFSDFTIANLDDQKRDLTVRHLLTMTTGIDWAEGFPTDDLVQLACSIHSVQYVLDKPVIRDPGTSFHYNTGASHLLAAIIEQLSGMPSLDFAQQYLFDPLGISPEDVIWMEDIQEVSYGGIGLFLTPRNLAKFGQLYLNKGMYNGSRILSRNWIKISTQDQIEGLSRIAGAQPTYPLDGYGFQWWVSKAQGFYTAEGYNGKTIIVSPEDNLVVVGVGSSNPNEYYNLIPRIRMSILKRTIPNASFSYFALIIVSSVAIITIWIQKKIGNIQFN